MRNCDVRMSRSDASVAMRIGRVERGAAYRPLKKLRGLLRLPPQVWPLIRCVVSGSELAPDAPKAASRGTELFSMRSVPVA